MKHVYALQLDYANWDILVWEIGGGDSMYETLIIDVETLVIKFTDVAMQSISKFTSIFKCKIQ